MRIGTSRADRLGFIVFVALAALLAVLLLSTDNASTESAQQLSIADIEAPPPTAVQQTEAIAMPTVTPTPMPAVLPLAAPDDGDDDSDDADDTDDEDDGDDSSTADGSSAAPDSSTDSAAVGASTDTTAAAASTSTSTSGNVAAPAATAAPNPQAAATAVPNPQPAGTAVPNPQPGTATAVPNPQPGTATAVPNPQPATNTANVSAPPPAAQGGTFTHTLTATVSRPTLHTSPGGPQFTPTFNGTALPAVNPTVFGNPLVYRVLAGTPDDGSGWAQVYVPARPNGTTAWVQTSQFRWGSSNRMIQISVSTNTVTVFEGGNVLLSTSAVTGKSSSRTPLANGWVEEIMAGPSSAYGPRLISLGMFSDDLNSFGGSIPKIALHGTNNPGLMGQYASNGCIRVPNDIINQIAGMVPVGSKVQIVG